MVVVRIWEGLGNQLFQYAYARALQLRTGEPVYLDYKRCFKQELEGWRLNRAYGLGNFKIELKQYDKVEKKFFFLRNETNVERVIFCLSKKAYYPIHFYKEMKPDYKRELKYINGMYYMMGWFQNECYFKEYREQLLRELYPKRKIKITKKLRNILENEQTVAVHVRRGDYRSQNNVLPPDYYDKAIEKMNRMVDLPYYIFFSDDMEWVKEKFGNLSRCYFMSEERLVDYEELLVMSRCMHNIIANSTFSWWGAWLNQNKNKIVIGPKIWFYYGNLDDINIMPKEWIRL